MTKIILDSSSIILTHSGRHVNPLDLQIEDVDIEDIAHSLSNLCRFTGHTKEFYCVAQHSVIVSKLVPAKDALWGLLHDSVEELMGDTSRPLKSDPYFGKAYRGAERRAQKTIAEKFDLEWPEPPSVKEADLIALATEARDLMPPETKHWEIIKGIPTLEETIIPWTPKKAKKEFLARFEYLS